MDELRPIPPPRAWLLSLEGRFLRELGAFLVPHHPVFLRFIADRLVQPEGAGRPFSPPAGWSWSVAPRVHRV